MKNVTAHFKTNGMADVADVELNSAGQQIKKTKKESLAFTEFFQTFRDCIYAHTEEIFEQKRQKLHELHPDNALYIDSQYLNIWKHKLAKCYINKIPTFGLQSTSRVEGSHSTMKSWLQTSKIDIFRFFGFMETHWKQYQKQYIYMKATALQNVAVSLSGQFWGGVKRKIWPYGLQLTLRQWEKRREGSTTLNCSGFYRQNYGLPCKHDIYRLIYVEQRILRANDFHPRWWIDRSTAPTPPSPPILPPPTIRTIRSQITQQKKKGTGPRGNRREPSLHESIDETPPPSTAPAALPTAPPPLPPPLPPSQHEFSFTIGQEAWERARADIARRQGCDGLNP